MEEPYEGSRAGLFPKAEGEHSCDSTAAEQLITRSVKVERSLRWAMKTGETPDVPNESGTISPPAKPISGWARLVRRLTRILWGVVFLLLALFVVRAWVLAPYRIPTSSMEPTLKGDDLETRSGGDTVLVLRVAYAFSSPARWDLVAFRSLEQENSGAEIVKRVVGLPGETVELVEDRLHIDNVPVELPEFLSGCRYRGGGVFRTAVTLQAGEYFVLGDNALVSNDSRHWGPLRRSQIFGKVVAIVRPTSRARLLP